MSILLIALTGFIISQRLVQSHTVRSSPAALRTAPPLAAIEVAKRLGDGPLVEALGGEGTGT